MLDVRNLSIRFGGYSRGVKRKNTCVIRSLDLEVRAGQILAIVGQSGAGKSLLAHAVLGILPGNSETSGEIYFKNSLLTPRSIKQLRGREIALIPQSVAYLNPLLKVGVQIARAGELKGLPRREARKASLRELERYGLSHQVSRWLPFQLSGGMTRRVLTATATIGAAELLLADEPTNGLDLPMARETMGHLRQLADTGKAVVLITHDIETALQVADKVSVFYGGMTIEEANIEDFTGEGRLRHPYTRSLWSALPCNQFIHAGVLSDGETNDHGCPFRCRCLQDTDACSIGVPDLVPYKHGKVRCWHA